MMPSAVPSSSRPTPNDVEIVSSIAVVAATSAPVPLSTLRLTTSSAVPAIMIRIASVSVVTRRTAFTSRGRYCFTVGNGSPHSPSSYRR